jgi:hypothetical protein
MSKLRDFAEKGLEGWFPKDFRVYIDTYARIL